MALTEFEKAQLALLERQTKAQEAAAKAAEESRDAMAKLVSPAQGDGGKMKDQIQSWQSWTEQPVPQIKVFATELKVYLEGLGQTVTCRGRIEEMPAARRQDTDYPPRVVSWSPFTIEQDGIDGWEEPRALFTAQLDQKIGPSIRAAAAKKNYGLVNDLIARRDGPGRRDQPGVAHLLWKVQCSILNRLNRRPLSALVEEGWVKNLGECEPLRLRSPDDPTLTMAPGAPPVDGQPNRSGAPTPNKRTPRDDEGISGPVSGAVAAEKDWGKSNLPPAPHEG